MAEAQPDLDALGSELLDDVGNVRGHGRGDLVEGDLGHDGGDEHGAGALEVGHDLSELRAVPRGIVDLRVPGVSFAEGQWPHVRREVDDSRAGLLAGDLVDLGHGAPVVLVWTKAKGNTILELHAI